MIILSYIQTEFESEIKYDIPGLGALFKCMFVSSSINAFNSLVYILVFSPVFCETTTVLKKKTGLRKQLFEVTSIPS